MSFANPIRLFLLGIPLLALAASPTENRDPRAKAIANQLRCPVCRGVPISESPSPLAMDMMRFIDEKLKEGKSDEEILAFFESRYGEWILLKPKPRGLNLTIWILPLLFLLGGGIFLFYFIGARVAPSNSRAVGASPSRPFGASQHCKRRETQSTTGSVRGNLQD